MPAEQLVQERFPNPIVAVAGLSRRFGKATALADVELTVPRGTVLGLVGANGAGKTTLIQHVLGLLRPQTGCVSVFGLDPVECPERVLARIGYLAEVNELPDWMSVAELMRFTRAFYPTWDEGYAESLIARFELEAGRVVRDLSKGQRARLALLLALSHRPELLVLDEPSSGLDPLVRRDILHAIIRTIADEGRTVLFSSHLLDEVERVADHVAIIDKGRIVERGTLDAVKARYHRLLLRFANRPDPAPPRVEGLLAWDGADRQWSALLRGSSEEAARFAASLDAELIEHTRPSLNEIFVGSAGAR